MTRYIFPIVLLGILFSSCEDQFETTLNIDPPPHTPELTLHSFIKASDEKIIVSVGRSFGLLETINNYETQFLKNATVEIFQQGSLKYTLEPIEDEYYNFGPQLNYGLELDEPIGGIGDSFEIKVQHPDFSTVNAVQYMPEPVAITKAKFTEDGGIGEEGNRLNAIDITFTDPAGIKNFYEIWVAYEDNYDGTVLYNNIYSETNDPIVRRGGYDSFVINDSAIDGKEYTINLQLDDDYSENMRVILRTVTEDWYLYVRSTYLFNESSDFGTFAEPVTVHRNINGGLGVFAAGVQVVKELEQ